MGDENHPVSIDDVRASPAKALKRRIPKEGDKNSRKKTRCETLHLAQSDVRTGYPALFASIFNGCPKEEATVKFRAALSEDCVIISRSLNNPYGPNYREIRGVDSMVEFFDALVEAVPDLVFQVLDTKFYKKPPMESMIVSSYTMTGRIIYTIDTLDTADVEDIDSAISGLQMLYESGTTGKVNDVVPLTKTISNTLPSVVGGHPSISSAHSSGTFVPIERFDYSAKFTPSGASLFGVNAEEEEDDETSASYMGLPAPLRLGGSGGAYSHNNSHLGSDNEEDEDDYEDEEGSSVMTEVRSYDGQGLCGESTTPPPLSVAQTSAPSSEPRQLVEGGNTFINGVSKVFLDCLESKINSELLSMSSSSSALPSSASATAATTTAMSINNGSSFSNLPAISSFGATVKQEALSMPLPFFATHSTLNSVATTATGANASYADLASLSAGLTLPMSKEAFWLKHKSNVMIVKEHAKFCLKEKVSEAKRQYKIKGTMTLSINADKKVTKVDLFHNFDTGTHAK